MYPENVVVGEKYTFNKETVTVVGKSPDFTGGDVFAVCSGSKYGHNYRDVNACYLKKLVVNCPEIDGFVEDVGSLLTKSGAFALSNSTKNAIAAVYEARVGCGC
jgi:hypothetical protein